MTAQPEPYRKAGYYHGIQSPDLYTADQLKDIQNALHLALEALKYIRTSSLADEFVVQQAINEINKVLKD